jgi:hypothetical protein
VPAGTVPPVRLSVTTYETVTVFVPKSL